MSDIPNLSGKVGLDVTDFKAGIAQLNREIRVVESGFKATAASLGDWGKSAQGLETRIKALNSEIDLQNKKVNALSDEYERIAKEKGDTSRAAQDLQIKLNKETEALNNMQGELGQTESSLKNLNSTTGKSQTAFQKFGTQFDNLKQQVPALGTAFNLLTNPISLSAAGLGAFIKYVEDATKKTLEYNKQVMEMSQITGLSAEETSRVIQVADDWEIEIGKVSKAMELMNKKGITPSIDNLAELADQYVIATDKSAFMKEASIKYGKSIGDLIPMLAKGGDALREQAASIDDNMIATDASIKASRDFKVQLDNLRDSFTGLEYVIGNDVIPSLTQFFGLVNKNISGALSYAEASDKYNKYVIAGIISGKQNFKVQMDLLKAFTSNTKQTNIYNDALKGLINYENGVTREEEIRRQKTVESTDATEEDTAAVEAANKALYGYEDALLAARQYQTPVTKGFYDQASAARVTESAIDAVNLVFGNYKAALGAPIQTEIDNFNSKQKDISLSLLDTDEKINELNGKKYLTDDQKKELADLKQAQVDLQTEYKNNADEHEKALRRILFDIYTEKLASADLTDAQKTDGAHMLEALALKWGLVDQKTLDAQKAGDAYIAAISRGDMAHAQAILDDNVTEWANIRKASRDASDATWDYNAALDGMDGKEVETYIITHHVEKYDTGAGHDFGAATGLDMIVRPGYPNDSFNLGLTSGERVIVIPPGEKLPNQLSNIQQIMAQSIAGLNSPTNGIVSRVNGNSVPANNPINITIQGAPTNEMSMRRLARYVATEIQRGQR
jgi:uncharacterized coiled-coil DUF342 family protein